jgi:hypothetical protein
VNQRSFHQPELTANFGNIHDVPLSRILEARIYRLANVDAIHHVVPRGVIRQGVGKASNGRLDISVVGV